MTANQTSEVAADGDGQIVLRAVEAVRPYLHSQGPIDNFIHHNTFHDFEDQEFEGAVEHVAAVFNAQPYLSHAEYRDAWLRGRIQTTDVIAELEGRRTPETLDPWQQKVLMAVLKVPTMPFQPEVLKWWLEEGPGFNGLEAAATPSGLFAGDIAGAGTAPTLKDLFSAIEARELLCSSSHNYSEMDANVEEDKQLSDAVIRTVAAYLDRGTARWHMPERELGLWHCAKQLLAHPRSMSPMSVDILNGAKLRSFDLQCDGLEACVRMLSQIQPDRKKWADILKEELFALPGWAGTVVTLDERGELPDKARNHPAIVDYMALRLLLRRSSESAKKASSHQTQNPLSFKIELFRVAQVLGLRGADIAGKTADQWNSFLEVVARYSDLDRRRILHSAYERSYRRRFLTVLQHNARSVVAENKAATPTNFQAVCCLDEREESFRRHLEEVLPNCMTFGAAGFFGIDMLYHPHDAVNPEPFCPAPVKPKHVVREKLAGPRPLKKSILSFGKKAMKGIRKRLWAVPLLPSAALTDALHVFFNVHMPRSLTKAAKYLAAFGSSEAELILTNDMAATRGEAPHAGFTLEEIADRIEGLLRTIGLTKNFTELVFLIGHGSTTTNNHFQSAYDCGACGGRRGQYNGRVFAAMANMPEVRSLLAFRGIKIGAETVFVGGIHDTCSDEVVLFDTEAAQQTHGKLFESFKQGIDETRRRNAHERYRRFGDTRQVDGRQALTKVEARAHHAGEVRPEYGHGSNAASFVGPRSTTQGLFLDRRCFLTSYDSTQDPSGKILKGLLGAIMPVCGGISLEYYFSRVDNQTFGCGTKLPHNLTAMLGIVDGPASDLRTGLPWQTVEIHEPMRLLTVIEAEVDVVMVVLSELPDILDAFDKGWGQLVVLSPTSRELFIRRDGQFENQVYDGRPCEVASAKAHYSGRSDHLDPAIIMPKTKTGGRHAG